MSDTTDELQPPTTARMRSRVKTIAGALASAGERARGLLNRREGGDRFAALVTAASPSDIAASLWNDLRERERDCISECVPPAPITGEEGAAYFVRSRAAAGRAAAAEAVARLPAMWLAVLRCTPFEFRQRCIGLGVEIAALASAKLPAARAAELLSPLGRQLARAAADERNKRETPAIPDSLCDAWSALMERQSLRVRGAELAAAVGLATLADLFDRLPAEDRHLATRTAGTNMCTLFTAEPRAPVHPDADARLAAAVVSWMLSERRRGHEA
ncbi:MAG: hypothetical protein JSR77_10240 [Planctomycetes bacterium]|nr:hypothetical protein [Planctomycetota bacterium]